MKLGSQTHLSTTPPAAVEGFKHRYSGAVRHTLGASTTLAEHLLASDTMQHW